MKPDGSPGAAKKLLRGFRFPLVVARRDGSTVHVWSAPPAGARTVVLERSTPRGWRTLATWPTAKVIDSDVTLRRGGRLRLRSGADRTAAVRVAAP